MQETDKGRIAWMLMSVKTYNSSHGGPRESMISRSFTVTYITAMVIAFLKSLFYLPAHLPSLLDHLQFSSSSLSSSVVSMNRPSTFSFLNSFAADLIFGFS